MKKLSSNLAVLCSYRAVHIGKAAQLLVSSVIFQLHFSSVVYCIWFHAESTAAVVKIVYVNRAQRFIAQPSQQLPPW